jgi:hypothetical protein
MGMGHARILTDHFSEEQEKKWKIKGRKLYFEVQKLSLSFSNREGRKNNFFLNIDKLNDI